MDGALVLRARVGRTQNVTLEVWASLIRRKVENGLASFLREACHARQHFVLLFAQDTRLLGGEIREPGRR